MKCRIFLGILLLLQFGFIFELTAEEVGSFPKNLNEDSSDVVSSDPVILSDGNSTEELASQPENLLASDAEDMETSSSEASVDDSEMPDETSSEPETEDEGVDSEDEIITEGPSESGTSESGEGISIKSFGEKYDLSNEAPIPFTTVDIMEIRECFIVSAGQRIASGPPVLNGILFPRQTPELISKWDKIRRENLLKCYLQPGWIDQFTDDHAVILIYMNSHYAVKVKIFADNTGKFKIIDFIDISERAPSKNIK